MTVSRSTVCAERFRRYESTRVVVLRIVLSSKAKRWLVVAGIGCLFVTMTQAQYQESYTFEPYLPRFCRYSQDGPQKDDRALTAKHYEYFGEDFHDVHHFCRGLYDMHKAIFDHEKERDLYLSAVDDFDYVLENASRDFKLRPDILLNKAIALNALGDKLGAAQCLRDALELRPDFDAAYVALANYFREAGDVSGCLEVLRLGELNGRDPEEFRRRIRAVESDRAASTIQPE